MSLTPKNVGDMKEKHKQEQKRENIPRLCLNSTKKNTRKKTLLEIFFRSWNKGLVTEVWKSAYVVLVLK